MACTTYSGAVLGVDGHLVRVEVDLVRRLPATVVVGLPSGAVRESTERVRSAIAASGFDYPRLRVTVNLGPADIRKEGTGFDLPIAVGILAAAGQIPAAALEGVLLAGELSLDGSLRAIRGVLAMCVMASKRGLATALLPAEVAGQASVVPGITAYAAQDLAGVVAMLRGERPLPLARRGAPPTIGARQPDMEDVKGQSMARRALEIAAAGGHNLLLVGPPGVGKTMLATRLPSILPTMSFEEALETSRVHSVAGLLTPGHALVTRRPFRAPHHSISAAGLIGGADLRPGEASLAHGGVLFLDELPEFSRSVLELLRGPLESREIVLSRRKGTVRLPASFGLVASANPCPCGYLGHPSRPCRCGDAQIQRYQSKLSGPLLDRIDLHVTVEPLEPGELFELAPAEASAAVRARVESARGRQRERFKGTGLRCNADLDARALRGSCRPSAEARGLLRDAAELLSLSGRGHDRVLKVSRTLADLDAVELIGAEHVAQALAFRGQEVALCSV